MDLKDAITLLEAELVPLQKAEPGTTQWCVLQAKSLGLSLLKKAQLQGITAPLDLNDFRADLRRGLNKGVVLETTDSKTAKPIAPVTG